jgi:competence protein ComGF
MKKKGSYSHNYDPEKLRELIQDGKNAKEIMKELKISKYSLQEQLLMLQVEDKKLYIIKDLLDLKTEEEKKWTRYRKDGVIFSERMLRFTGFKPGDAFEMVVEEGRIILKKI